MAEQPSLLDGDLSKRSIRMMLSTKLVKVKIEKLVYPFSSFLAEFGGALGLFLGFSIIMVWDMILGLTIYFKKYFP